jgi:hypothetical protein
MKKKLARWLCGNGACSLLSTLVVAGLSVTGYANTTLYSTGFEASEGYPDVSTINYCWMGGTPPQWSGGGVCKSGFSIPGSDDGGPAAFAGTQTAYQRWGSGSLTFNTNPNVGNSEVFAEAYLLFTDHPGTDSAYEGIKFGLLDSNGNAQIFVKICDWSGTGNGMFTTWNSGVSPDSTANQATSWTGVNNQWSHVGILVDYETGTADIYQKMVNVGDTSALTASDIIFNDVPIYTGNQDYASTVFIQSDFSVNGHFDNISVTAIPEPVTLVLLGLGGLALVKNRRKGLIG